VFRVDEFPRNDGKVEAKAFFAVNGGCAANAAVAVARLAAAPCSRARWARSDRDKRLSARRWLGDRAVGDFINARGERTIVTYRDQRIAAVTPRDPEALAGSSSNKKLERDADRTKTHPALAARLSFVRPTGAPRPASALSGGKRPRTGRFS
jgi:hypothetical protein